MATTANTTADAPAAPGATTRGAVDFPVDANEGHATGQGEAGGAVCEAAHHREKVWVPPPRQNGRLHSEQRRAATVLPPTAPVPAALRTGVLRNRVPTRTRNFRDRLRDRTTRIIREIVPDLAGRNFYIILDSDLPSSAPHSDNIGGCASAALATSYRDAIGPRWKGRGPAVVVAEAAWKWAGAHQRPRHRIEHIRRAFLEIAIHEAAHVVDRGWYEDAAPTPETIRATREAVEETLADAPNHAPGNRPPFHGHEWQWLRIVLHLIHRANAFGYECFAAGAVDSDFYGLSYINDYARALGDEPDRFAYLPFATINHTLPPPAFCELWNADVERWLSQQSQNTYPSLSRPGVRVAAMMISRLEISMSSVLNKLSEQHAAREAAVAKEWALVVRELGDNKDVTPERIEALLAASGKKIAALNGDVDRYYKRKSLIKKVQLWKRGDAEYAELRDIIQAEAEKLEAARRAFNEKIAPLQLRMNHLTGTVQVEGAQAERELLRTAPPEMHARMSACYNKSARLMSRQKQIADVLGRIAAQDSVDEDDLRYDLGASASEKIKARLKENAERRTNLEAELVEVRAQADAVAREGDNIAFEASQGM